MLRWWTFEPFVGHAALHEELDTGFDMFPEGIRCSVLQSMLLKGLLWLCTGGCRAAQTSPGLGGSAGGELDMNQTDRPCLAVSHLHQHRAGAVTALVAPLYI